ncbi:hypothetical protein EYF80_005690 [Liparis tanakae]|uniref:Uncharacterized protein n=1 Tax=Liparis tanakae TaxID=230148 RepID=A0A4Z2J2L6_9TELE|nr:hypothetical protein EYF80_005690 [Liparis tanakae]
MLGKLDCRCVHANKVVLKPQKRGALANHSGGSCSKEEEEEGEEMKGNKVSVRLSRHSGEQAQTTSVLLYSASTQEKDEEKTSACCSTDSLTIFQKQSETARLKFFVVTWWAFSMPSLPKTVGKSSATRCERCANHIVFNLNLMPQSSELQDKG